MTRHLTLTGYYAGVPLCGSRHEGDTGWHAAWLTDQQLEDYRHTDDRCDACLAVWDEPEMATA